MTRRPLDLPLGREPFLDPLARFLMRALAAAPETAAERDRLREINADMLAALEACEDLLAELQTGGAENPELEIARAAIAKARGGQ